MLKFVLKRLAFLPFVMFGVTALLFGCLQFLSPEMRASLYIKDPRQLSQLDAVIEKYGLRKPVYVQYGLWLKQVVHGELGYSETAKMPVAQAVKAFFPATLELTLISFIPILIVGEVISLSSSYLLRVSPFVMWSGAATTAVRRPPSSV